MPKHPKRPRDSAQLAKMIVDIATGETKDRATEQPTAPRGAKGGKIGGKARAATLSHAQRVDIAREAAIARWKKGS